MTKGAATLLRRWFPRPVVRDAIERKLSEFYAGNTLYHAMTDAGGKIDHPQVKLLECLISPGGTYAELGCGGGAVCELVGRSAKVHGFDVSEIALARAKERCAGKNVIFRRAQCDQLPLNDGTVDGCYSFEVFEHLWEPVKAIEEMVRITKSGGFILVSVPLAFSLDLHLPKKISARCCEIVLAGIRLCLDMIKGDTHCHIEPDLLGEPYPDCDMITALRPVAFARAVEAAGCNIEFCDTTYMCAHKDGASTDLAFQKNTARPFWRNFGDHLLLLATKR